MQKLEQSMEHFQAQMAKNQNIEPHPKFTGYHKKKKNVGDLYVEVELKNCAY